MVTRSSSASAQTLLSGVLISGAAIYFAYLAKWNAGTLVTLNLWPGSEPLTRPVWFPLVASFAGGFLIAVFVGTIAALRRLAEIRRAKKQVVALHEELARLRSAAAQVPGDTAPAAQRP